MSNHLIGIYQDAYSGKCKHKYYKLEGEECYECERCGSMGGWCWKCGDKVYGRKNKEFCRSCAKEIKEFILNNEKKVLKR